MDGINSLITSSLNGAEVDNYRGKKKSQMQEEEKNFFQLEKSVIAMDVKYQRQLREVAGK